MATPATDVVPPGRAVRADYHVHTEFSYDCSTPLDVVLERAARAAIRCLCVADHGTIEGALALKRMAPPEVEILVGCEFTTDDGSHVIGVGLTEPIGEKRLPVLIERIKEQGGLVMLPHPFRRGSGVFRAEMRRPPAFVEGVIAAVDLVECFNGADSYEHNGRNRALAERSGLRSVASSDAHSETAIGSVFVEYADRDFVHGGSHRAVYFAAQPPSPAENSVKKRLLELYHAHKHELPEAVNAAYRLSRRALRLDVEGVPAGPPELQYRLPERSSLTLADDT